MWTHPSRYWVITVHLDCFVKPIWKLKSTTILEINLPVITAQMNIFWWKMLMKPHVESLKDAHMLGVYKMVQTCFTRCQWKIDFTTLLHKIILVYTLRSVHFSWAISLRYNCTIPHIQLVIRFFMWQRRWFGVRECKPQPWLLIRWDRCKFSSPRWISI